MDKKFKTGDKVILLSMTSSTPRRPTLTFTVQGRIDKYFISAQAITPEGETISVLRTDNCFIPAHVVRFIGNENYLLGDNTSLYKGLLLTVKSETDFDYICFETGIYPISKELCEDVEF